MRCPNCGTENAPGAHFCSNCGRALGAGEPTEPVGGQPGAGPTQPVVPQTAAEPTVPLIPNPPSAPHQRPVGPPPGGGGFKLTPPMLAIGGALLVVLIGLVVWALFLRGDDEPVRTLPTPTGTVTGQPQPTGTTGTDTGPTGATGTVTGTTGATGATGGAFEVTVEMCQDVTSDGSCVGGFPYDAATGWSIPVTAPSFTVLVTTANLQPGDVISLDITDTNTGDQYYETSFDPAPAEVVDYENWVYWLPLVFPETGSFPSGSANEVRFYRNGEPITFQGSNAYTFGEFGE
jgi:hypothetical protein